MSPFAKSLLGKLAGSVAISVGGLRPSDLLEFEGSVFERLDLDSKVLAEISKEMGPPGSTYETIMRRRAMKGYGGYLA